jgi:hypothetical protein
MAYVRKEEDTIELAYSLNKVWRAIPEVLKSLGWKVEHIDNMAHRVKARTRSSLMSWGSVFLINAMLVDESTARVSVAAETVVTTVTALVDFGRARRLIDLFLEELRKQLEREP